MSNLSINLLIVLDGAQGERFARVKVPEGLPRLVRLPDEMRIGILRIPSIRCTWCGSKM